MANRGSKKRFSLVITSCVLLGTGLIYLIVTKIPGLKENVEPSEKKIQSYQECVDAGYSVLESYPRKCRTPDGREFAQNIVSSEILPADNQYPAAGACMDAPEEEIVVVEINEDIPSPRCQKVTLDQKIKVVNNAPSAASLWFGNERQISFTIESEKDYLIDRKIGDYLESGVHIMKGETYQGPEIWYVPKTDTSLYLYKFDQYAVKDIFTGIPAIVNFETNPKAKTFFTKISQGAKQGPNFAGHYTIVEWDCGERCQAHVIVDAKTGEISDYGLMSAFGLDYKKDSNLLVVNSAANSAAAVSDPEALLINYYELTNGKLKFLAKQKIGENSAVVCAQVITTAKKIITGEINEFPSPCEVPYGWEILSSQGSVTGIRGKVMLGPTCPVIRIDDPLCADKPYAANLDIKSRGGEVVTKVRSGDDGLFEVQIPPGEYLITQSEPHSSFPRIDSINVSVEANQMTDVTVNFDTGIR